MEIRKALPHDAVSIAALEAEIFPDPWCEKDILSLISTEDATCFVAERDGAVCAYVLGRMVVPEGEIYRIAVSPDMRGRSIGYRLLDRLVKEERTEGLESLFLEVRSQNIAAISLYRAYGFHEIARRRGYYRDPADDAIIMLKAGRADMIN